jgi:hypothetical protein
MARNAVASTGILMQLWSIEKTDNHQGETMRYGKCVVMMCVLLMPLMAFAQDAAGDGNIVDGYTVDGQSAEADQEIGRFGLYLAFSPGWLFSGKQKETADDTITPKPQSYGIADIELGLFAYVNRYFGLEANYAMYGEVEAEHEDIDKPLSLYEYWRIQAGPVIRLPLNSGSITFVFSFAGGINYCSLDLSDDYKDLIRDSAAAMGYSVEFYDKPATGVGGYARIALDIFFGRHFFIGMGLQYEYLNTKFQGASEKLDGHAIFVPLRAGIAF